MNGIAKLNRYPREKFRFSGDSIASYPKSETNFPHLQHRPIADRNPRRDVRLFQVEPRRVPERERVGVARKMPIEWFFCESCPAVSTSPIPNGNAASGIAS